MKFNAMRDASPKYQDFKKRGFIPEGEKSVWQEFIKTSGSQHSGTGYKGKYTAEWYTRKYDVEVEYYTDETLTEYLTRVVDIYLERHKYELLNILDKNDFLKMAEKYGDDENVDVVEILSIDSFANLLKKVKQLKLDDVKYFFRNTGDRDRQTESDLMEEYFTETSLELDRFEDDVKGIIRMFDL